MQDKALYLLAEFDDETQSILAGYYNILSQNGFDGTQTKGIPYHITLGSRAIGGEQEMLNELDRICVKTPRIEIMLSHIGLFGLSVLFIEPNMNFELLKLQSDFFNDCGYGCHPWTAHATLLIDEPYVMQKALLIIAEKFKPFKARIEGVSLYEFFPARLIAARGLAGS